MPSYLEAAQALVEAGYLEAANIETATAVLGKSLIIADAEDTKEFAAKDLAYQQRVISHAEEMAEEDLKMLDFEDRFVQAEVIESAASLAEKDRELIKRADKEFVVAFRDATAALTAAKLIAESDSEAAAGLLAEMWGISEEE